MKQAESSLALVKAKRVAQSGFQYSILVVIRWLTDEIQYSRCCLLVEGAKNIIIFRVVDGNPVKVELGFSLCEPHLRLRCPQGR